MAWQMSNGWLIDPASGVDIDSIYDFRKQFGRFIRPAMLRLILPGWCEK